MPGRLWLTFWCTLPRDDMPFGGGAGPLGTTTVGFTALFARQEVHTKGRFSSGKMIFPPHGFSSCTSWFTNFSFANPLIGHDLFVLSSKSRT